MPVAHLAFDYSRVNPIATRLDHFLCDLRQQIRVPTLQSMDATRTFRQATTQDLQRIHERQLPRWDLRPCCRLAHQLPHYVVSQEQAVDLLHHPCWRLAAQHWTLALVRFQLVDCQLLFPSLVVQHYQPTGRMPPRVQQGGQQPVSLAGTATARIVQRVLNDPHHDPAPVVLTVPTRRIQLRQVRPITQPPQRFEHHVALDATEQVRSTLAHSSDQVVAQEAAVPEQQHVFCEKTQQITRHQHFATVARFHQRLPEYVRADLAKTQDAGLWKRPRCATAAWSAEGSHVGRRIGDVDNEAVHGHQSHTGVETMGCLRRPFEMDHFVGQQSQRRDADALPRLAQCRASGRAASAIALERAKHLTVRVPAEQSECDDEPDHEPARQPSAGSPSFACLAQDDLNGLARNNTLQRLKSLGLGPLHNLRRIRVQPTHRSLPATWAFVLNPSWQEAAFL